MVRNKPKSKDWIDRLRPQAKAEILATVLHHLECAIGENYKAYLELPPNWRRLMKAAMVDCSIEFADLSKRDIALIQEWLKAQDAKEIKNPILERHKKEKGE